MDRYYNFAVMQFVAHAMRGELLNVGLAVVSNTGLDIRIPRSLDKLRAISSALDLELIRESLAALADLDKSLTNGQSMTSDERFDLLGEIGGVKFVNRGRFSAESAIAYENAVKRLFQVLVDPEPAPVVRRFKRSKLLGMLKAALKQERVLAKKGEELSDHRVVANVRIAEGLQADLVLKNGAMHVIETVDVSSKDMPASRVVSEIAVAALVLEQSRMVFGQEDTKSRLVYDAAAEVEAVAMPSLLAAANQGAELFNWSSADDRSRLINLLSNLATPYENRMRSKIRFVHASIQDRLKLN